MVFSIFAVIGLLAVIGSKFLTMARIQVIHRNVAEAESDLHRTKNEFKASENYLAAAIHDLKAEENKQRTLTRKIEKYDKDLKQLKE